MEGASEELYPRNPYFPLIYYSYLYLKTIIVGYGYGKYSVEDMKVAGRLFVRAVYTYQKMNGLEDLVNT